MLGGDRITRVNELVHHEVSGLIRREVELPFGIMVTVVSVQTSHDLGYAKVYISALPSSKSEEALTALNAQIGRIQHLLNRKLVMLKVPRIRFVHDTGEDRAAHLEHLLDTIDGKE